MKIDFGEKFTVQAGGFFQYDYGQTIEVYNTGLTKENIEFQYIQDGVQITQLGVLDETNQYYTAAVPDSFLQKNKPINCYIYNENEETGKTEKLIILSIVAREKYEPIPDEQEKHILAEILDKLNELQYEIEHFELTPEQLQSVVNSVLSELSDNIYTKQETDAAIQTAISNIDLSAYATKSEVQELSTHFGQTTSALGSAIGQETSDRTSADSALSLRITNLENTVGQANAILEGVL
jgi:hypothetical protein